MKYKFIARSKNDPNGANGGLGFHTSEAADAHRLAMNALISNYPNGIWNVSFWTKKPEEWEVIENK